MRTRFTSTMLATALSTVVAVGLGVSAEPAAAATTCLGRTVTISGTPGDDNLQGTNSIDVFDGLGGNDRINGLGGNDVMCGGPGNDSLRGDAGADTFSGGLGDDRIEGGNEVDTVDYQASPARVQVDLLVNRATGGENRDTLIGIEDMIGSRFGDSLSGDDGPNRIVGKGGADFMFGQGGDDQLADRGTAPNDPTQPNHYFGGLGDDIYFGGPSWDVADYSVVEAPMIVDLSQAVADGEGHDLVSAMDEVIGTRFSDGLIGDGFANVLRGGDSNDVINGKGGNDLLEGGRGVSETLDGAAGFDMVTYAYTDYGPIDLDLAQNRTFIDDGTDTLASIEGAIGSRFGDHMVGDANANTFDGFLGDDEIDGAGGSDYVEFFSALRSVNLDLAADRATGQGTDVILSVENARGSNRDDTLRGDDAVNNIVGGFGDTIEGRGGNDILDGDTRFQGTIITYASAPAAVVVDLGSGTATGGAGNDQIRFHPGFVRGSDFNDRITCKQTGFDACFFDGRRGNDILTGGPNGDDLTGNLGNDTIDGRGDLDIANFTNSADVTVNLAAGTATGHGTDTVTSIEAVFTGPGNDTIIGGSPGDQLLAGNGNDRLTASVGGSSLDGGPGDDALTGSNAIDFMRPGEGNDIVTAAGGNDYVDADDCDSVPCVVGNDQFNGGAGTDTLDFAGTTNPLSLNLVTGVINGHGNDTATSIEDVAASDAGDTITGTSGPNRIDGRGGDDIVDAGDGSDTISGSVGNDTITAGPGDDTVDGQGGNDEMHGGPGNDTLAFSGPGTGVTASLGTGSASGHGTDTFDGFDNLRGTGFPDTLTGNAAPNVIDGQAGTDTCVGGGGADTLLNCP
jgi:Ca2+-binding RTX toxin-like protein